MDKLIIQDELCKSFVQYREQTAIEYGQTLISYGMLDSMSDGVKRQIINAGIQPGEHIGLNFQDKGQLIGAIIGILKAGCVFACFESKDPVAFQLEMMKKAGIKNVLSDHLSPLEFRQNKIEILSLLPAPSQISQSMDYQVTYQEDGAIYIYFTSGTTGFSKAIIGRNASLVHFLKWEIEEFKLDETCRISQFSPCIHDPFLRDIFVPLLCGGMVIIPETDETLLSEILIGNWIEQNQLTLIHATPSLFRIICGATYSLHKFNTLKFILLAGEKISVEGLGRWYRHYGDRICLVNLYGPTETTLAKTYHYIREEDLRRNNVPVGKPIDGCKIAVISETNQLCLDGEIGEIIIRTPYRTLGYYNDEEQNNKRFIQNMFSDKKDDIIFRTGDYGRWLNDGNLELTGRKDRQIKIRGHRVELDACENIFEQHPEIHECAVVFKTVSKQGNRQSKNCKQCGITDSYPGISLNYENVCNMCEAHATWKEPEREYFREIDSIRPDILSFTKSESDYDCLFLYSGGKDSTYALYRLAEMGLRILAFTFDNGFISKNAIKNIKAVVNKLNVDHVTYKYEAMKPIFCAGLKIESSVCNGCFKVLRILSTRLAYEKKIGSIITGFSRGQIYDLRLESIFKSGIQDMQTIEEKILEQRIMYHCQNNYVNQSFKAEELVCKEMLQEVALIDFYRYTDVKKSEIIDFLKQRGFLDNPEETGACSTNCLINDVGIYFQGVKYSYDNYVSPRSWEARLGHITLEEAVCEGTTGVNTAKIESILRQLDYDVEVEAEASNKVMVAYYTSSHKQEKLYEYFANRVPSYMLPHTWIHTEKIPKKASGKTNYQSLENKSDLEMKKYIAPISETEKGLEDIWCKVLGYKQISIDEGFMSLGGSSLNIMKIIADVYDAYNVEIPIGQLFSNITIKELAVYIEEQLQEVHPLLPITEDGYFKVSPIQQQMYILYLLNPKSTAYNITFGFLLEGNADILRLELAYQTLLQRHDLLRTSFHLKNNQVVQVIDPIENSGFSYIQSSSEDIEKTLTGYIKPFDLSVAPLIRMTVMELQKERYFLLIDMHHIIGDGFSSQTLLREFSSLYQNKYLTTNPLSYRDYVAWLSQNQLLKKQEAYWLEVFKTTVPQLSLPTDRLISKKDRFTGALYHFSIDKFILSQVKGILQIHKYTYLEFFITVYNIFLAELLNVTDISIGVPASGRSNPQFNHIVGPFINMLPIRTSWTAENTYADILVQVQKNMHQGYENQDYPLNQLIEKLNLSSTMGRNPLYETIFVMQHETDSNQFAIDELKVTPMPVNDQSTKYMLSMYVTETLETVKFTFEYNSVAYHEDTIKKYSDQYVNILKQIIASINPECSKAEK